MTKHIVLTGEPGIGKTTVCKNLIHKLQQQSIAVSGFYSEEVRDIDSLTNRRVRVDFDIVSVDEKLRAPLARVYPKNSAQRGPTVSKYTVLLDSFERTALPLLQHTETSVIVIDEIGKMELFSHKFKQDVVKLFESGSQMILCTVPASSLPFVNIIKSRPDVKLVEVTRDNRHLLSDDIYKHMIQMIS